jgi:hypothetical protein
LVIREQIYEGKHERASDNLYRENIENLGAACNLKKSRQIAEE